MSIKYDIWKNKYLRIETKVRIYKGVIILIAALVQIRPETSNTK